MKRLFDAIEKSDIFPGGISREAKADMEQKFRAYMDGVLAWNDKVNLTAITGEDEFIKKHFVDSVMCAGAPEIRGAERIADIGTGAGFPGVPLAILFPEKKFYLVDSLAKRLRIVDELCAAADIRNVTVIHGRAEDLASKKGEYRENFDCVVSRAVAGMATLAELCIPFCRQGGTFIAYKGRDFEEELEAGTAAIKEMGGEVDRIERSGDPEETFDHALIYIRKEKETPDRYPRKAGDPARKPIR